MSTELDGTYNVTTTSSDQSATKSDGQTCIEAGQTSRLDDNKCKWTSTFEVISENEVKMTSIADASQAKPDFFMTLPNGTPTREPMTFESTLKLARKGDLIQMSGQIDHAGDMVFITMRKILD